MPAAHRADDLRICSATTIVTGQSTVFVAGKLWSVEGDPNSDGGGGLVASATTVKINNIPVIVLGNSAFADDLCPIVGGLHCTPSATTGSPDVVCYG